MENDEIKARLLKLQAQSIALQIAVRYLVLQDQALARFLQANAQDLADALLNSLASDSQVQEAAETLRLLAAPLPS